MFKKDRESFAAQWDDLRIFIEYGMLTDEKFMERAKKFMLFKDTTGACMTYEELIEAVGETQKDKNGKVVLPYTADATNQHGFIAPALGAGVLMMKAHWLPTWSRSWKSTPTCNSSASTQTSLTT